ncbi:MAG: dolichol kinase [Cyanobacteria bacterium M_surface_7_m2_040]|nr:dolichol kinase [Cyanobacteria bacterium K_Offshore_0m_m2_072]MBM5826827.1 dolichol kinase [Cyanobacteria bacterium M_surface_7_m2_040]
MGLLTGQPWWLQQGVGIAAVALWLTLLAIAAIQLRRHTLGNQANGPQREWSRKLVHIGTGAVVPLAWLFGIDRLIAIPAAAGITVLTAINHRHRLLPAIEDVGRHSYGTVAYGAAITVLLLAFWPHQADAVCAGVLVMAIGDGLAGVIGAWIPSTSWQLWGHRKSVLGTATMALASAAVLSILAGLGRGTAALSQLQPPSQGAVLAIALIATALEQLAWMGIDNLTVPIISAWLWASWR